MDTRGTTVTPGDGLEPELVLPEQFSTGARSDASLLPEKRLMLAVLEDAVAVYRKHVHSRHAAGRQLFEEADEWIRSDDVGWPYSFVNICHVLGFDVDYMRDGLARWAKESAQGAPTIFRRIGGSRSRVVAGAPGVGRAA
jgi:hypothetical protein